MAPDSVPAELLPVLRRCEERRRQLWSRVAWTAVLAAALLLIVLLVSLSMGQVRLPRVQRYYVLLMPIGAAALLAWATARSLRVGYRQFFKREAMPEIVKLVAPGLRYAPGDGIPRSDFVASRLFQLAPDRYHAEDLIVGQVGATEIEASEVHAEQETEGSDNKKDWSTIFRGYLFVADFHKHFHGHTLVLPDRTQRWLGGFAQTLQGLAISRPGRLVKLEDPEFERYFCVYSDDQVEARYILSPSFMRRLLDLRQRTRESISVAFHDSRVFVAFPRRRDMFEPPLMRSLMGDGLVLGYLEDVRQTMALVEDLNLNTRLWSKA